jgi:hypothetical protein
MDLVEQGDGFPLFGQGQLQSHQAGTLAGAGLMATL